MSDISQTSWSIVRLWIRIVERFCEDAMVRWQGMGTEVCIEFGMMATCGRQ